MTPASAVGADAHLKTLDAGYIIRMDDMGKTFGSVVANAHASLRVKRNSIHALVGENGAGKSTLMRILAGIFPPQNGMVEVNGRDVTGWTTSEAIAAGVGMVHQHFMLVPTLTVAENVVLGAEPGDTMSFDRREAVMAVQALSERTGLQMDPETRVADLSVGEAQRVEILKVLYRGAKILILDEPTAVLSPPEVLELWRVLRRLRDDGGTIVLITHKLDEVMAISDDITVMRAGETVAELVTADVSPREIARVMVGRDVALHLDQANAETVHATDAGDAGGAAAMPLLRVNDLSVASDRGSVAVDRLSFEVAAGEILGIAGVEGNGQTELIESIAGLRRAAGGEIVLGDASLLPLSVRQRSDAGLSHIPEDRHRRGLVLDYSIADNLILGRQHHFSRWGRIDTNRVDTNAYEQISRFDIRPAEPLLPASALSGGNQQKIVIAREMGRDFAVLLASQPTRGVDVGAIEFIHSRLRKARDEGKAILLVSADLSEVLALSDRVAVMYRGRFATVLPRSMCNADVLGPFMTGAAA